MGRLGRLPSGKGQITLEYIFLAALSLVLISLSLTALLKIREAGDKSYKIELFRLSALDIYNMGEEACAMGSGNSFQMNARENVEIRMDGGQAVFSNPGLGVLIKKDSTCEFLSADIATNSTIRISNENGKIKSG